jgi:DNA repair exonuclease SbcCD ATPase subunit
MWCFSFHFDHQLRTVKDYLSELLSNKQIDLDKHFDFTARANDMKVTLESSLQKLKESDEVERVQGQITELVKYISEVTATSEYLEQLVHVVETTTVDKPMEFVDKIEDIKIDISIPEFLNEVQTFIIEDEKFPFKNHVELMVDNLVNKINEVNNLEFIELENRVNEGKKIDVNKSVEKMELLHIKLKEDLLNLLHKEQMNSQPVDFNNSNRDLLEKKFMKEMEENKKRMGEEVKEVEMKIAEMNEITGRQSKEIEEAKKYMALQQQEIKTLEDTRSKLQALNKKLKEENEEVIKRIQEFKKELSHTEVECKNMQDDYSKLLENINKENRKLQVLQEEVARQEDKCKEAKSLQEYKKVADQKILMLTKKSIERNMKLRNELKGLKAQVMDMSGFIKKLVSLFHRRKNTLYKAVHQTLRDEQMAYNKCIQHITKDIHYNKNYREKMRVLLNKVKVDIKEVKAPLKSLRNEIVHRNPNLRAFDSIRSLRNLLSDTATFTNSLKKLSKAPLDNFAKLSSLNTNKKFKDIFKVLSNNIKELKLSLNNANKQIAEIEAKKEVTKKQIESLLRSNEEGWDLCEAKDSSIKDDIIEVAKCYLQIK